MSFFKLKVGETVYELDKLTMGDTRTLKHHFGVADLAKMSSTDPDVIVGVLAIAIQRKDGKTLDEATAEAESIDFADVVITNDESAVESEADAAPLAGASVATDAPPLPGGPVTTPEPSGLPQSDGSTDSTPGTSTV